MPADVRIEKERALAGYQADLEKSKSTVGSKRRNDIISRYHMVRFFGKEAPKTFSLRMLIEYRAAKGYTNT